jgi:excisionase family DNA binding protein
MSPPRESYYTTKSAAALLLVHPDTIARLIASGALRSVGTGRLKRIAQSAINEYLAGTAS